MPLFLSQLPLFLYLPDIRPLANLHFPATLFRFNRLRTLCTNRSLKMSFNLFPFIALRTLTKTMEGCTVQLLQNSRTRPSPGLPSPLFKVTRGVASFSADSVSIIAGNRPSCPLPRRAQGTHSMVTLRNVVKDYPADGQLVRALNGISLNVAPGEFVALVGRSGCGKSTLLNLAGAMDFPTSGEVLLDGVTTNSRDDSALTKLRREKVGFVFQSFQLINTLSVVENVELPLLLADNPDARRLALERLASVELSGLEHRMPHQLSGGQMQRVAIARALVNNPKILLADEPTGNLDTTTGAVILDLLKRLASENKVATLMATHSMEAAAIADVVVELRDGSIATIKRTGTRTT